MKRLFISENADPNYLATVTTLQNIRIHTNSDNLSLCTVFGNQVVVHREHNFEGEKVVYFPVESTIAGSYLSWANMYSDTIMNNDTSIKGYFGDKRRVKATRLRGEVSNGIVIPVSKIVDFLNRHFWCLPDSDIGFKETEFVVGESFDTIYAYEDKKMVFVEKYVPQIQKGQPGIPGQPKDKKEEGIAKLLIPNQFRFHGKTTNLGMAVHTVEPDDTISISNKLHGTSAVFSNVMCRKPLSWKDKIAKFFGVNVVEQEYRFVYSSRNTLKNRKDGEYSTDVWGEWAEQIEPKIPDGFSIYGEIVGYTKNGRHIQSNYPYGCKVFENQFYVYRVTYTDKTGHVLEFDWQQVGDFCEAYNLERVPTYYHGKAKDLFDIDSEDFNWSTKFLEALKEAYLEKDCEICNNGMPREGVCLRRENTSHKNAYKLKSFKFLEKESKDRDDNKTNMEEEEAA